MHNLRLELEERYPALKFIPVIGDVRIPARLDFVFRTYHRRWCSTLRLTNTSR